jgi:uncharacterized membrane protein YedE/YeeE
MGTAFTPFSGFAGGVLIGLAAVVLLAANGRIAGVSGIAAGITARGSSDRLWRLAFVLGLLLGAALYAFVQGAWFAVDVEASLPVIVAAGLLVGFGTRLGSGCTSGHGVCGIARLSLRSIVATLVFMAAGVATVWVTRHLVP